MGGVTVLGWIRLAMDAPAKFALLGIVDDYVRGNALSSAETGAVLMSEEAAEAAVRFGETQLATGDFPHTRALFGGDDPREALRQLIGDGSERDRFRQGLSAILHGVASRMKLDLPER